MKLSVIIPVYRVETTLQRCVESVRRQTFADMEIILVDDGSPDRCPQLCDEWARTDSRISVVHKPNGGLSDARNAGLDVARGDIVTFVDSDDFIAPDTYRQAMDIIIHDTTCDIVEFPLYWHHGAQEQRVLNYGDATYDDMGSYWLHAQAYRHAYAWNKLYRHRLFDGVRFPVGRVFEDVATLPLLLDNARRVRTTSTGLYYYCANPVGITATAQATELKMLLENHLNALSRWVDDAYYMHVLNIQLDVVKLTGEPPRLPARKVSLHPNLYSNRQWLKALALNILGLRQLCKLYTLKLPTRNARS